MIKLSRSLCVWVLAAALLSAIPTFAARQADPYISPGHVDLELELDNRARVHSRLVSERVVEGLANPIVVTVDDGAIDSISEPATTFPAPTRVGVLAAARTTISFAGLTARDLNGEVVELTYGALRGTSDGGFVYTARIEVPQASALRLHLKEFWLPESAQLWLYNDSGEVFGPYAGTGRHGDGDFWSHTLMGEDIILQIRQQGAIKTQDLQDVWFQVSDIGFLGDKFAGILDGGSRSFCNYNASCIENNSCTSSSAVNTAESAIAHMQWISGPYLYICTGGLIADTANSGTPYFLTANHCIRRGKDARNVETFFQYDVSCGTSNCPSLTQTRSNHPQNLRTVGASIRATGATGDYTLLELNQSAPGGSAFLGWNSTPVANNNGATLHRISHPDGAPQAYSRHSVSTSAGTCQGLPRGSWIYSRDTVGATDGGSSGAPVVNAAGEIVGQLTGACGTNLNNVCDSNNNATLDGAFAAYFSSVSSYLDNGGSCTPSPENCTNGSDDDCDGDVDCNDSDCTSDPACAGGSCGGSKDPCSSNSDCCSNNCKRGSCKGN